MGKHSVRKASSHRMLLAMLPAAVAASVVLPGTAFAGPAVDDHDKKVHEVDDKKHDEDVDDKKHDEDVDDKKHDDDVDDKKHDEDVDDKKHDEDVEKKDPFSMLGGLPGLGLPPV